MLSASRVSPAPPRLGRFDDRTPGAKTPAGYWVNRAWMDYQHEQRLLRLSREAVKIDPDTLRKFTEDR